jgi:hypothetical protein
MVLAFITDFSKRQSKIPIKVITKTSKSLNSSMNYQSVTRKNYDSAILCWMLMFYDLSCSLICYTTFHRCDPLGFRSSCAGDLCRFSGFGDQNRLSVFLCIYYLVVFSWINSVICLM